MLRGNVLITGGAGFLARAIYRRAKRDNWPARFTCFSRDQAKHVKLLERYPDVRCIQGDVTADPDLLAAAITGHDVVLHAAATKYVDLSEFHAREAIRINLIGSLNVIQAAVRAGVGRVVGISTDKACAPSNVYGMTKALMERAFAEASTLSTAFITCRYGNVVGSTGSVIPLFKRQYEAEGQVKITNPTMTRFWMPVDEAIDLILLALRDCEPGWTAIPYPAAMKIVDVARAATVDDVKIEVVGQRPGEKSDELLVHFSESVRARRMSSPSHWMALVPSGAADPNRDVEAFTLASSNPSHWVTTEQMRAWIADAETV